MVKMLAWLTLTAAMLAGASGYPALADNKPAVKDVPSQFCTGQNCLPNTTQPQGYCQGLDCGASLPKEKEQQCDGQDCAPITDQADPAPKDEAVTPNSGGQQ